MKKTLVWTILIGLFVGSTVYEFAIKPPADHHEPVHKALKSRVAGVVSLSDDHHTITVTPSNPGGAVHLELGHMTTVVDAGAVVEKGQRLADHANPHEHWSVMAYLPHHFVGNIRKMLGPSLLAGDVIPLTHVFMALVVLLLGQGHLHLVGQESLSAGAGNRDGGS